MSDFPFVNHDIAPEHTWDGQVRYELKPCHTPDGAVAEGLYSAWITLDNPAQYNSYTTQMVKDVILGFRKASNARDVVAVVFTAAGTKAFCTGGNTKEYAEYYAGKPGEYSQYMRLFNDMVTAILTCDKPTICRVNGMRIAGGQEIGMACDITITSDLARFGQAGPKHGSAPDGGSTDFLPLYVGMERAMVSGALCEIWSAHKSERVGLVTEVVPALRVDGELVPNPLVITDRWLENGRIVFGEFKTGDALAEGKATLERGEVDLSALDEAVDRAITGFLMTMPNCVEKTIQSLRKHKLEHWDRNRETNRAWLALNMMTEARAGFRAFNEGPRGNREPDYVGRRQRLARVETWGPELIEAILPKAN